MPVFVFFLRQIREFNGQPGSFRRSMGAVHEGVLHSLQSSYTFFSPCLQTGPLNPSILGCTDTLLPQSISCHHPQLPTPSPIPGKQKQPSLQTPLGHSEGSGQRGLGCTPCSPHPESQAPFLQPRLPLQGSRSFRRWGQGVWAAYTLQTANSSSLGTLSGRGTTWTEPHVLEGLW